MKYLLKSQNDIIQTNCEWILAMDISKNNKLLATGGYDKTLVLWDLENHKKIKEMITGFKITEIKIDPASKFVVCGCGDYLQIFLFQIANLKKIQLVFNIELPDNIDECRLNFTPDSKNLITPTFVWNLQKRKIIRFLYSEENYDYDSTIVDQSISFDQKYLMKYTSQFQIQIISFSTLNVVYENEMVNENSQGDDLIKSMRFSTTSNKILGWCDTFIKIWDYENFILNQDKPLIELKYQITKLWCSPDLSLVAIISLSQQDYVQKFSLIDCLNQKEIEMIKENQKDENLSLVEQLFFISFANDLSFYVTADYNSCLRIYRRE